METQPTVEQVNRATDLLFDALGAEAFGELPLAELTRLAGAIIAAEVEAETLLFDVSYQSSIRAACLPCRGDESAYNEVHTSAAP